MSNYLTIEIPTTPFKVSQAVKLYEKCSAKHSNIVSDNDDEKLSKKEILKIYDSFITYINKYYYETSKGDYFFYDVTKKEFEYKTMKHFQDEVCNKMGKVCFSTCFRCNVKIYKLCAKFNRPRLFEENEEFYINECHGYLHKKYKKFNDYSQDIKDKVQLVLDMIKEISCNNKEDFFNAYIKYMSQMCKGEKTEVIIYKKSEQGIGKGTETDFLINYVLGEKICLICSTEPLLEKTNMILLGKIFVLFEELPVFSESQWAAVSSKLKTYTTEKLTMYRGLFKDPIQAENISNFMINTNNESIKDKDGRRIIEMPLNYARMGDYDYFENIKNKCFNLEVGEAFFSLMMEQDTSNFYAQNPKKGFPETDLKRTAIAKLLPSYKKFLKFEYVLKNRGIEKTTAKDLHEQYKSYCNLSGLKPIGKNDLIQNLQKFNITTTKNNGYYFYNVPFEKLKELSDKGRWICDYDYYDLQDDFIDDDEKPSALDQGTKDYDIELKNFILKKHGDEILNKLEEAYFKAYGHHIYKDLKEHLI